MNHTALPCMEPWFKGWPCAELSTKEPCRGSLCKTMNLMGCSVQNHEQHRVTRCMTSSQPFRVTLNRKTEHEWWPCQETWTTLADPVHGTKNHKVLPSSKPNLKQHSVTLYRMANHTRWSCSELSTMLGNLWKDKNRKLLPRAEPWTTMCDPVKNCEQCVKCFEPHSVT